ncbi:uncharacterized protein LOC141816661 [Curcuma longa]|uniref:uncharacterized protein LOC141816661 n=1 Tax=Curcuma longa TaxID=136217 RepID=UPI003D9F42CF
MEFLCCRRAASRPPGDRSAPSDARPAAEKAVTSAAPDKRRSRRAALPLWRPSLGSISEDAASAGVVKSGGAGRGMAKSKLNPKPPKPAAIKVESRAGKDVYKCVNMHELHFGVLPTFAPTAFLF